MMSENDGPRPDHDAEHPAVDHRLAERFRRRYGEPGPNDLRAVLDKRPDVPPEPGDEVPEELRTRLGPT